MKRKGSSTRRWNWAVLVGTRPRSLVRLPTRWWPVASRWDGDGQLMAPVRPGGRVGRVYVVAQSVSWLRRLLAEPAGNVMVHRVTVKVLTWWPPRYGWSGRLGALPSVRMHRMVLPPAGQGGAAVVEIRLAHATPLYDVLVAALGVLAPVRPLPRPVSADITALGAAPPWSGALPAQTVLGGPLVDDPEIRPYDLVLSGEEADPDRAGTMSGLSTRADRWGLSVRDRQRPVLIDARTANPIGRRRLGPDAPVARLEFGADGGWRLIDEGPTDPAGPVRQPLPVGSLHRLPMSMDELYPLRQFHRISCRDLPATDPAAVATMLAQLAANGALLDVPPLPEAVAALLAPELRECIDRPLPDTTGQPVDWEIRSVEQRRAALRGHSAAFALGAETTDHFPGLAAPPSVSAILVTRRPDYVADAVRYIAEQTYPNLEIVLCMHGLELDARLRAEVVACGRPVEIFTAASDLSFGEVMGAATDRARGSLVTKFDDDDVYGPEHVWDLVLAREFSGAELVGKAAEFVYLQMLDVTVRRLAVPPETYAPPVAGGTMLMSRADLEDIGGWRPVPRSVDRGLMDRVYRAGGVIYRTHPFGYIYERRTGGHTWDAGLDYFLRRSGVQWAGLPPYREFGVATKGRSASVGAGGLIPA